MSIKVVKETLGKMFDGSILFEDVIPTRYTFRNLNRNREYTFRIYKVNDKEYIFNAPEEKHLGITFDSVGMKTILKKLFPNHEEVEVTRNVEGLTEIYLRLEEGV